MSDHNQLHGSCACERNQYTIIIPAASASLAQVFFDNTTATRRTQASPVSAWLRVPLDWYHSSTYAQFPDETHASIKRTFHTHTANPLLPPTRRQFCGYCGTHLTAWSEGVGEAEVVDVTLGSLLHESLERLEALRIYRGLEGDEEEGLVRDPGGTVNEVDHILMQPHRQHSTRTSDGLIQDRGASVNEPDHIRGRPGGLIMDPNATVNEPDHIRQRPGGLVLDRHATMNEDDHVPMTQRKATDFTRHSNPPSRVVVHKMNNRGLPYFEEMVEHSRLGRIKHQMGGQSSADGSSHVQWEIIEIGGDEDEPMEEGSGSGGTSKRLKMDL